MSVVTVTTTSQPAVTTTNPDPTVFRDFNQLVNDSITRTGLDHTLPPDLLLQRMRETPVRQVTAAVLKIIDRVDASL